MRLGDGPPGAGVTPMTGNLRARSGYEQAVLPERVRNDDLPRLEGAPAPQDDIEIERACTPALAETSPAEAVLDLLQSGENVVGRLIRPDDGGGIGVKALRWSDRSAFPDLAGPHFPESFPQRSQSCPKDGARRADSRHAHIRPQRKKVAMRDQRSSEIRP